MTDRQREPQPGSAEVSAGMDLELCKLEERYGPVLLRKRTPVFLSFLEREEAICEQILTRLRSQGLADDKRRERYAEVEKQLQDCRRARNIAF
ncbi:MAG: hypothetical protein K2M70_08300 [Lachnospiraceae bacterium]|nr:hypothetical protein [Lachnospiraceae bacterium]